MRLGRIAKAFRHVKNVNTQNYVPAQSFLAVPFLIELVDFGKVVDRIIELPLILWIELPPQQLNVDLMVNT